MKDIDKEIETLFAQRHQKKKIEVHLKGVKKRLSTRNKELDLLDKVLEKEQRDVVQLERLSLRGLFSKVLGNKEEQLERERQDYLLAFLNFHECRKRIEAKEYEIEVLEEKLTKLKDVEAKLKKAVDQKKNFLKFRNKVVGKKIILQEFKVRTIKNKRKDILQAISHGTAVLSKIHKVQSVLMEMDSWKFLSNNRNNALKITPFYDQKKFVRKSKTDIGEVSKAIDTFVDELNDVSNSYKLDYSRFISQLTSFLVRFYDGLMTDWIFEKEIKTTLNVSEELKGKVLRLIEMLKKDLEKTQIIDAKERELLESLIIFSCGSK